MKELTIRQWEYLLYFAAQGSGDTSVTTAARRMGVHKATVCTVCRLLAGCGLTYPGDRRPIRLTPLGEAVTAPLLRRQAALEEWLVHGLGLPPLQAEAVARRMAAALNGGTIDAIVRSWRSGREHEGGELYETKNCVGRGPVRPRPGVRPDGGAGGGGRDGAGGVYRLYDNGLL